QARRRPLVAVIAARTLRTAAAQAVKITQPGAIDPFRRMPAGVAAHRPRAAAHLRRQVAALRQLRAAVITLCRHGRDISALRPPCLPAVAASLSATGASGTPNSFSSRPDGAESALAAVGATACR